MNFFRKLPAEREIRFPTPLLEIVCPASKGHGFRDKPIADSISREIGGARRRAEVRGDAVPLAIVYPEDALIYRFDIPMEAARREIENVHCAMAKDIWVAVAFPVMVKTPAHLAADAPPVSTEGCLLTPDSWKTAPKRDCTDNEHELLRMAYGDEIEAGFGLKWAMRRYELEGKREPYLATATPNGIGLEYRVCADSAVGPIEKEPSTITLVSAFGLSGGKMKKLIPARELIVVNDSYREGDAYGIRAFHGKYNGRLVTETRLGESVLYTVYDA